MWTMVLIFRLFTQLRFEPAGTSAQRWAFLKEWSGLWASCRLFAIWKLLLRCLLLGVPNETLATYNTKTGTPRNGGDLSPIVGLMVTTQLWGLWNSCRSAQFYAFPIIVWKRCMFSLSGQRIPRKAPFCLWAARPTSKGFYWCGISHFNH